MKKYLVTVDGLTVGIIDLTPDEVKALLSDEDIAIKEVSNN